MNKQEWSSALKSFVHEQRQHNPIPDRDSLSEEEEWHCQFLGGAFINWYNQRLDNILAERDVLSQLNEFDPEPLVLFTTTMPGLVAAQEIMPDPPETFFPLLHAEFEKWQERHTVDSFTFHIHHWSHFDAPDKKLLSRVTETYPAVSVDEIRIHFSGDRWGDLCGVFGEHLWRWNGQEFELLEEAFTQGAY